MPLGREVGVNPSDIVFSGEPAPFPKTAGWMKIPLSMEVDLSSGYIVSDGDPAPPHKRGTAASPSFRPVSIVVTVAHLS